MIRRGSMELWSPTDFLLGVAYVLVALKTALDDKVDMVG